MGILNARRDCPLRGCNVSRLCCGDRHVAFNRAAGVSQSALVPHTILTSAASWEERNFWRARHSLWLRRTRSG